MKAVLATVERADGRFLVHRTFAEQPDAEWWVSVSDGQGGTVYQINDDARFLAAFSALERPAMAVPVLKQAISNFPAPTALPSRQILGVLQAC